MKHSIQELQLAAAVRELAVGLRHGLARREIADRAREMKRDAGSGPQEPKARQQWLDAQEAAIEQMDRDWHGAHPITEWVPAALASLEEIASMIKSQPS